MTEDARFGEEGGRLDYGTNLERLDLSADDRRRLERRLGQPSLWDAFTALLGRSGGPSLEEITVDPAHRDLFELSEALLDHDEAFVRWRSRHVLMVERQIGSKPGTGGSTGASYLRSTLAKRFFPDLWAVRGRL